VQIESAAITQVFEWLLVRFAWALSLFISSASTYDSYLQLRAHRPRNQCVFVAIAVIADFKPQLPYANPPMFRYRKSARTLP
jgi:hypothetical protein